MDMDQPGGGEFTLPMDDYEQLIFEHRQDDQSSQQGSVSPTITPVKKKAARKESSPTSSITGSNASTPEPEEGKCIVTCICWICLEISLTDSRGTAKKVRRPRGKRSDATPEPASKAATGRRSTRGSAAPRGGRKTKKK